MLLVHFLHAFMMVSSANSFSEFTDSNKFDLSLNDTNLILKDVICISSIKVNILFINRLLRNHNISYINAAEHCLYKQSTLLAHIDVLNRLSVISIEDQL